MQVFFEFIGIEIPLSVEIAGGKPIRFPYLAKVLYAYQAAGHLHKLPIHRAVFFTSPDVVNTTPKILRHTVFAGIGEHSAWVACSYPFEYAIQRFVKNNRVVSFLHQIEVEHSCLAKRHPIFESRFNHLAFGNGFSKSIVVVNTYFDRVTSTPPMDRRIAVACLSHCAYINKFYGIFIRLTLDSFYDVFCCPNIHFGGKGWVIISHRSNHTAHVQHIVGTCNAFEHIVVIGKVAINDGYIGFLLPFLH